MQEYSSAEVCIYVPKKADENRKLTEERQRRAEPGTATINRPNAANKEAGARRRVRQYENFLSNENTKPDSGGDTVSTPINNTSSIPQKKKVALVTDDAFYNRMVMKEMLKKFNVIAIEANNGEEAASMVEKSFGKESEYEINIILMDLNMPVMNGVDSTIKIRQLEKEYDRKERIPIVAVTAHDSTKDRVGCLQAGMQEYQLKPVTSKQLEQLLKTYSINLLNNPAASA